MSAMRKVANFLGFVENDDDFEYDQPNDSDRRSAGARESYADEAQIEQADDRYTHSPQHATVSPIRSSMRPVESAQPGTLNTIRTIKPSSYNDAEAIGLALREGVPVVMDLSAMDDAYSKRLVDFSAGLVFGLNGSMERVTADVFLLSPEQVTLAKDVETHTEGNASLFNQS